MPNTRGGRPGTHQWAWEVYLVARGKAVAGLVPALGVVLGLRVAAAVRPQLLRDLLAQAQVEPGRVHRIADQRERVPVGARVGEGDLGHSGRVGVAQIQKRQLRRVSIRAGRIVVVVLLFDGHQAAFHLGPVPVSAVPAAPVAIPAAPVRVVRNPVVRQDGRACTPRMRRVGQVVDQDLSLAIRVVGRVGGRRKVAEEQQLIAVLDRLLHLPDRETGNWSGTVEIAAGCVDPELREILVGIVVIVLLRLNLGHQVLAELVDLIVVGCNLDDRLQLWIGQVLQAGNRGVGVGQINHHALASCLVPEDDGAEDLAVGMDEGTVVLQHGLLGRGQGVVVLGQVPGHDPHGTLVLVPPPIIVRVALGPVIDRHSDHVGLAIRIHPDHLVGLVQIPGNVRADPLGVLYRHALALHQPDLGQVTDVDDADRDVGRPRPGGVLESGAGRTGVLTNA